MCSSGGRLVDRARVPPPAVSPVAASRPWARSDHGGRPTARTHPRRGAAARAPAHGSGAVAAARRTPAGCAPARTRPGSTHVEDRVLEKPSNPARRPAAPGGAARGPATTAAPSRPPSAMNPRRRPAPRHSPRPQIEVDEFRPGQQVDVGDARSRSSCRYLLEVPGGAGGVAKAEFELAERGRRPDLVQPRPELGAELERFGGTGPALLLLPPAGVQPGQAGQAERQLGLLPALPGQVDRLLVGGLGDRQPVGGGLVAGDQVEHEGQRADRGAGPGGVQRMLQQRAPGVRLAQEQRDDASQGISWRSSRSSAEFSASAIASCIASAPAAASPPRIRAIPAAVAARKRARTEAFPGSVRGPAGDRQHLGRVPGAEAGEGGLGEHRDSTLGVGPPGCCGEDRVAAHHRAPADRYAPGELVDPDQPGWVAGGRAGLSSSVTRDRPAPASQPASAASSSSRARRSLSAVRRPARSNAAAAVA